METLFRFAQIRPPHQAAHQVEALSLANRSPFQLSLAAVAPGERPASAAKGAGGGFASSPAFVGGTEPHPVDTLERAGVAASDVAIGSDL